MDCPDIDLIERLLDGQVPERQAEVVERHIEECTGCQQRQHTVAANLDFVHEIFEREVGPLPAVDGYDVHGLIHRGAQGAVYLAGHVATGRAVALKVGHAACSVAARRRFLREIELASSLLHPNVVTVLDGGITGCGRPFLAMELVRGLDLDTWLANNNPSLRVRVDLLARIAEGVAHAHRCGVIHRDLKPSNILVDEGGSPRIVDFGLALVRDPAERSRLTQNGQFVGTLAYAAPEQLVGDIRLVDVRTDVYALGVLLARALTGQHPFSVRAGMTSLIDAIRAGALSLPGGDGLPVDLRSIALKAMARDPERRYQGAAEFAADLQRWLAGEPVQARHGSGWYVAWKTIVRHRFMVSMSTIVLGTLLLSTWQYSRLYGRAELARIAAELDRKQADRERQTAEAARRRAQHEAETARSVFAVFSSAIAGRGPALREPAAQAELLAVVEHELREELQDQPEVLGRLQHDVGQAWARIGRGERAAQMLALAVATRRTSLGPTHPDTLASLLALARTEYASEKLPAAEARVTEVERQYGQLGPAYADEHARCTILRAQCRLDQDDRAGARQILTATAAARAATPASRHEARRWLAAVAAREGDRPQAMAQLRQLLQDLTAERDPARVQVRVQATYDLVDLLLARGEVAPVRELLQHAVADAGLVFGPWDSRTVRLELQSVDEHERSQRWELLFTTARELAERAEKVFGRLSREHMFVQTHLALAESHLDALPAAVARLQHWLVELEAAADPELVDMRAAMADWLRCNRSRLPGGAGH